ncbi:MAG: hypothetical protein AAF438_16210 [Pseudomonadota bacterium]
MSGTDMVFGIVLVVMIATMYNTRQRYKYRRRSSEDMSEFDERLDKLEDLEQRVQVLERVVTDKKFDLREEIDRL